MNDQDSIQTPDNSSEGRGLSRQSPRPSGSQSYFCASHLNTETMQWEYAPRYVTQERGHVAVEEEERCPDCGHTPETGACFRCKMD